MRAWIALATLLAACAGGGTDSIIDGLWYVDDGRTILIQRGQVSLESGEVVGSVELLNDSALRYRGDGAEDGETVNLVLQVEFPTSLRMTWTRLDGTRFRELTRVADVE